MNKNDWYNTESWYAPIQQEPERSASAAPIKNKKKAWKSWHVLAIVGLVALLIWRFITYYILIIVVGGAQAVSGLVRLRRRGRTPAPEED